MTAPSLELAEHPYASFVHRVQKPARYLGGELGAAKKDWGAVKARVCLAFPDVYDIGMSHLGFKILYKILNDDERTLAERAYAPWIDMEAELRKRELPLVSCDTARPLSDFDVVGFSLQFELTYTNILMMLELGRVPRRSRDRGEADPLVIAGGPTATHPEPLADFIDAFVIGDGEESAKAIALAWTEMRERGLGRADRLRELTKIPGVYVPSLYETAPCPETGMLYVAGVRDGATAPMPVKRTLVDDLNDYPFPDLGPIGGPEAIFDRMSIEIARGCTEGCRFCQAGMIYRPVRERDPQQIVDTVVSAVRKTGYDEVSLTSLSTADYSCIAPLIKKVTDELAPKQISLGVSSLRAYGLDENVLDDMQRVRASGVTFAPEAGSQRMRDVVNKNVTEEQLMQTAERIFSRGWNSMKLYFMIGLPTEEESDVREIPRVGGRARAIGKRVKKALQAGGAPNVTVSVSTHVPKPHTPFQWCAMDKPATVHEKQRWLLDEAKRAGVDLRMHDCDTSWLEGVFARGDRKLCDVLERAYLNGARFDSWEETKKLKVWEEAFAAFGVDPQAYLGTLPVSARLPWDHIDVGLEEGFLLREYRKAVKSRLSVPCGKAAGMFVHHANIAEAEADHRKLVCYDCGVACDLSAMRKDRLVALRKLGADEPRPPAAAPVVRTDKTKRPTPLVQGEPRRYRFLYTKLGPSAFLSHLDLIRALPRAFRRLELPLFYSQGFHPKPDMTFGPALSLGVSSLCEIVDLKITADIDASSLLEALTQGSQDGIAFLGGARLGGQDAGVSRIIDSARYVVGIPRRAIDGEAWLAEKIAALEAAPEAIVVRRIDGVGKRVNVKDFLRRLHIGGGEALARAGIVGDLVPLEIDVSIRGNGAVKVGEVVEALVGHVELPNRAARVAMGVLTGGEIVSPMELERVKKREPAVVVAAS